MSPTASAPASITVAGTSYTLGSTAIASQVSSLNGGGVGQVVTLLLGMNNVAAGIITGEEADEVFYGVVQSASRNLIDEDNSADVLQTVKVLCTDGLAREVNVDKSLNFPTGWLVEVRVSPEGESVETIDERSVSGTVNENATALGDRDLADDVQILDTSTGGVAGTVRPSRLSGVNLKASDVRYYTTNPQGQIDKLILNDVTGDLWYYGVLDDVKNVAANYSTLLSAIKAQPGDGTIDTDAVVSEVKSIMVPTTTEILWGVISGDMPQHRVGTPDQQHRRTSGPRLPADRQDHRHALQPDIRLHRQRCDLYRLRQRPAGQSEHFHQVSCAGRRHRGLPGDDRLCPQHGAADAHEDRQGGCGQRPFLQGRKV